MLPAVSPPPAVQGVGSGEKIAQALQLANQRAEVSVLILCRGGGSIEDLWAYNEEVVARAIAASMLPVVTGIGHETDFTIADFVADERAPTPTAAAQRVVPDRNALMQGLRDTAQHLQRPMRNRIQNAMQSLDYLQRRLVHPEQQLQRQSSHVIQFKQRLQRSWQQAQQRQLSCYQSLAQRLRHSGRDFERMKDRQFHLSLRLNQALKIIQARQKARLESLAQHLLMLNPEQVLARGYSLVQDVSGNLVSDARQLKPGKELHITFAAGTARAKVLP